jgi:hypothetical protein
MSAVDDAPIGGGDRRAGHRGAGPSSANRRIRNRALLLTSLALAFYFGFIAVTLLRSHHG